MRYAVQRWFGPEWGDPGNPERVGQWTMVALYDDRERADADARLSGNLSGYTYRVIEIGG